MRMEKGLGESVWRGEAYWVGRMAITKYEPDSSRGSLSLRASNVGVICSR